MNKILIFAGSYIAALLVGHFFVRLLLKRFRPATVSGVRGAGALIGILERALVLTFVLLHQYTAIGLVLTAKSIARYEELKNRDFAEYYLIGTLGSILFAILVGILTSYVIKL